MKKLPVVGSTAATTAFCGDRIDGLGGTHLFVDGNSKITRDNGTFERPEPNAFSLEAAAIGGIEHCPGSTATCRAACYVGELNKAQAALYETYRHNSREIRVILADPELAADWVMRMASWITMHASGGWRWHVSGDVYSLDYARWIRDVCLESPTVRHWIYTRSFEFLAPLVEVSTHRGGNLAINLSADADNYREATRASLLAVQPPLRLAYLTVDGTVPETLLPGDVIFPDYMLRPRQHATLAESDWWQTLTQAQRKSVCPVDAFGKGPSNRCGPCAKCL
jgi:hypothetical protein